MLVKPFVPDLSEVLPPHLIEPVLVPVVYKSYWVYGRTKHGGSSIQSRSASYNLDGSRHLDLHIESRERGTLPEDDFNEAIKDQELKIEELGEPHEAR
jgi:hypothetical protein